MRVDNWPPLMKWSSLCITSKPVGQLTTIHNMVNLELCCYMQQVEKMPLRSGGQLTPLHKNMQLHAGGQLTSLYENRARHAGGQLTTLQNLAATCRLTIDHPSWKYCCYIQVDNWPSFVIILLLHAGGQLTTPYEIVKFMYYTRASWTIDHRT